MDNPKKINQESMLKIGTILHGTYRIDGYLSSGGFGNTYVATHTLFGTERAIKEFFMKGVNQREDNTSVVSVSNKENVEEFNHQLEKFKKEAKRLYCLDNKNIVKVHDLFEENGTAYYVMDYIDGEDLRQRLDRMRHPLSEEEVMSLLPQMLDALQAVHSQGIWHLDLKPANIMVDSMGHVKLIDFGASKQFDKEQGGVTTSAVAFTNGYAPFEQMEKNHDKFGPWTDFYALGATLYNLLSDKKPPMPSDINDDHSDDKHLALPMPSSVSRRMRELVLWMLNTNRSERPQSVQEINSFLNSNVEGIIDDTNDVTIITDSTATSDSNPSSAPAAEFSFNAESNTIEAICTGHEVELYANGTKVSNPYIVVQTDEEQCIHFSAITKRADETNDSLEIFYSENPIIVEALETPHKPNVLKIILTAILMGLLTYVVYTAWNKSEIAELPEEQQDSIALPATVNDARLSIPLGDCFYSGEVNDEGIPHGKGVARFIKGDECVGTFVNGNVEGDSIIYTLSNGDTFKGSFKNNEFNEGRYTIKADGSYFNGTFKKNSPETGQWYDSNNRPITQSDNRHQESTKVISENNSNTTVAFGAPNNITKETKAQKEKPKEQTAASSATSNKVKNAFGKDKDKDKSSVGDQQGTTRDSHNQGQQGGKPSVSGLEGYTLDYWAKPVPNSKWAGRVVVKATVNSKGLVIKANAVSASGDLASHPEVKRACEQAAIKSRFSVPKNTMTEHEGTITYIWR